MLGGLTCVSRRMSILYGMSMLCGMFVLQAMLSSHSFGFGAGEWFQILTILHHNAIESVPRTWYDQKMRSS